MYIPKQAIIIAQKAMEIPEFFQNGLLDQRMEHRLMQVLNGRTAELSESHRDAILTGGRNRKFTAYLQLLAKDKGIETGKIDGLWGPMTDFAYESLLYLDAHGQLPPTWRDETPLNVNPNHWPQENEAAMNAFYGQVGTNQTSIQLPYQMKINWNLSQKVNRITCNKKVADSVVRVLTRVKDHYGVERIAELHLDLFGGCLNVRKMRGGTRWSTHSWGIALDFDTQRNKLEWGRDQAAFARPEYLPWWGFWEEEGWTSLGRVANYDWMHIQAAKR